MSKIIFTVSNDLNFDQRMIRICSTLKQAGYDVLLVGRKRRTSTPLEEKAYRQKRLKCLFESGKLFYIEYNLRLLIFLLFAKADAICAVDLDTIFPGFLISKIKATPCIYDAHEFYTEVPELVDRPAVKKVWESLANSIIPKLKYAYTVGPALANILSEKYQIQFKCIRNVPLSKNYQTDFPKPHNRPYILYQGALNMGRGLEQTIEAMKQIENLDLLVAGEGDLSDELRTQVEESRLSDKIKFLGWVSPEKLIPYTQHAFVGLNLLENKGLSYFYSLSNKTFDYIHSGVPSLQMAFPEYEALNNTFECSLLLNDLNPNRIGQAIQSLQKQKEYYQELKDNCGEASKVWNWEKESKILIKFYREVLLPV